ncbi:ATP-binding protein [candidate division KSB1 bacterium]|nr:ATP-binding protein [candidate division KSB1 bacterium]
MKLFDKIRQYHFQLRHVLVLLVILLFFQISITFVHKISLSNFLLKTQEWYQFDSAEKLAALAATSLELLLETTAPQAITHEQDQRRMVQAFNIILTQQILQRHVEDLCVLVTIDDKVTAIDNGQALYEYLLEHRHDLSPAERSHEDAIRIYSAHQEEIRSSEQIYAEVEDRQIFHIFVPFVPRGEFMGAVYMRNKPDFSFITDEIITSYNELTLIFMALIVIGLLAMVYISSYTLKERDEVQSLLYREREIQLKAFIQHQKESLFTKRIYHTHHKAEKVMGFIKEDLRSLSRKNIDDFKFRVTKYANFISRVIYDMKWYEPPLHAIRNPLFNTDLNQVIRFIVDNIFKRTSSTTELVQFHLDLAEGLPSLQVNEFVIWEIIEPLIQNSLEHGGDERLLITLHTHYNAGQRLITLTIGDNGKGIHPDLLRVYEKGIKKIFLENTSTKTDSQNAGYGCYIAYEIAVQRCGWKMDVENLPEGGCRFTLQIPVLT